MARREFQTLALTRPCARGRRGRCYENWESAVRDYVQFLSGSDRYSETLRHAQDPERFADELQKAGYATDPAYARKLKSVINRVQLFTR